MAGLTFVLSGGAAILVRCGGRVLHPGTSARKFVVKTAAELQAALAAPHDSMIFIEAVMDKCDVPQLVLDSGHGMADTDYGPRGPQHQPGVQL